MKKTARVAIHPPPRILSLREQCRFEVGDFLLQEVKSYKGFEQRDFFLNGHLASIVLPTNPREDKKWIWRTEFLGAFDSVDLAMLDKGFYLVYFSISNMYGCPESIRMMKGFYDFLVTKMDFHPKGILFGFSRGGLYALNFTARYPGLVTALYLDAPVIDIASWPGGLGTGTGSPEEFVDCLKCHGYTVKSVNRYGKSLSGKFHKLLDADIPLVIVAGDSDDVVPHVENCEKLVNFYQKEKGRLLYILKPGCGHHPHSLEDPAPVVNFLMSCIC